MDTTSRPGLDAAVVDSVESGLDLAALAGSVSPVVGRYFERSWSHGVGHRLYDTSGMAYLDFTNSIAVTVLGHRHPEVTAAIHAQVDRLIGPTGAIGYSEPVVRLAERLANTLPETLDTVMFLNSGSEAIEAALKLARRSTGRPGIIAFRGGFHGRTFGAASVTSSSLNYRTGYEPLLPSVYLTPFPAAYRDFGGDEALAARTCMDELRQLTAIEIAPSAVAAVLIEPVQGEGGYYPAPAAFVRELRTFCDEHGILLIADEVQSGYGRTGRMWAFEHAGIVPDVVCIAKAIANGLPLSAIAAGRQLHERWGKSAHGSTFGGNPVACAAGLAVLDVIERDGLVANAAVRGQQLTAGLMEIAAADEDDRIGDVRGPGLMIGVELVKGDGQPDGDMASELVARCADEGLLILTCGPAHNIIRWIAPLDVTDAEIAEGLGIFRSVLQSI